MGGEPAGAVLAGPALDTARLARQGVRVRIDARPGQVVECAGRLGFDDRDLADLRQVAAALLADVDRSAALAGCVERLRAGIGRLAVDGPDPWAGLPAGPDDGLLPLLALLVVAPDVVGYQVGRGVPERQAWTDLSDIGQQVWVHRLVYGRFGLHNQGWLRTVWAGAFAWLGRLQFNLQWLSSEGEWVLSTHIPRRGPDDGSRSGALSPDAVDESFVRASHFYAEHFPDLPATDFWCHSWLLAPELAAALPGSNIAAFQQRWKLDDRIDAGDDDAVYFTFARQSPYEPRRLPRTTRLEWAVASRLEHGGHWPLRRGRIAGQLLGVTESAKRYYHEPGRVGRVIAAEAEESPDSTGQGGG